MLKLKWTKQWLKLIKDAIAKTNKAVTNIFVDKISKTVTKIGKNQY